MVQTEGLAAFWETAPVKKIFNITGCVRMKTRVTAVSSRYPAQSVEWILFLFLFFWTGFTGLMALVKYAALLFEI
jgi:hypothetical protein